MKHKEWKIKKPMLFVEKYGILIFPLTAGILFLLQNTSHTIVGSQIDWISQHTVLAEYFRQRFYSTLRIRILTYLLPSAGPKSGLARAENAKFAECLR